MAGFAISRTIHAPIDVVWGVLVDVERMPEWTSTMRAVRLTTGSVLRRGSRVHITQPWLPPATWVVELLDPPRHFTWRSRTGLVETVTGHLLEDRGATTEATLSVRHSGPGAGFVGLLTGPLLRRYVEREMSGLKARAEELVGRSEPH
jgi:uncharacterized membrane protein